MELWSELIELVLPSRCVGCARPGVIWCVGCQPPSVGRRTATAHGPPGYAAGDYADGLRTALVQFKEERRRQLLPQLADYLTDAVDAARRELLAGAHPVLVPVPSRRAAARQRGGDHVVRLARRAGRALGLPVRSLLTVSPRVADSAGLSATERRRNLSGRMAAVAPGGGSSPHDQRIILIDDIVTTGATLAEAARALTAAGWSVTAAAVVAETRLRLPPVGQRRGWRAV